ncbi:NAD-dependent epimerase/dehydratase family protein [Actinomarinicola tropica]|uniref:NAD-dependent epimerase/dehydratase family protein n=1 Tax=Actinomarinicola tropica TaxID=2789776 RepID=A0A5Q2RRZ3_9ACTN|nr:NAD-dependent epimerase/dehydratase family protein [Actinomarinicola tropica]QGG95965.1 NAD-dependent epimerase/dehydratase family protein [Actinomarinicola tropica]
MGRRVLVTGLGTFWGGRVAQALESEPDVDVVVGMGVEEPKVPLERTEFVRADASYSILSRLVKATQVDTIVHTHLVVDQTQMPSRQVHETNVIGTMNLLAAASDPASSVRDVIVKSSTLVYGSSAQDPTWFTEETPRRSRKPTGIERSLEEVEGYVRDFALDNPHVNIALLRFCKVLGEELVTPISRALQLPLVPSIAGFDPRMQFVHETDVVAAMAFVLRRRLSGVYNVAGDGVLPWSEVAAICGKRTFPITPYGTGLAGIALRRLGLDLPDELLTLLRYGRGVDNSRLKDLGFAYRCTTAGTVRAFAEATRLRATVGDPHPTYTFEQDVEQFFRHSPAVVRDPDRP